MCPRYFLVSYYCFFFSRLGRIKCNRWKYTYIKIVTNKKNSEIESENGDLTLKLKLSDRKIRVELLNIRVLVNSSLFKRVKLIFILYYVFR